MSLRLLLACALLAPAARPALAVQAPEDLAPVLVQLEQRDRAQQAEFEAAKARPLPPKARQRLEETRRAWAEGQGRLVQLLRATRASGAPAGVAAPAGAAADRDEALELLRRIRAASRPEPLSVGELKTRIPDLQPPALAVGPSGVGRRRRRAAHRDDRTRDPGEGRRRSPAPSRPTSGCATRSAPSSTTAS